jgi:hypothetical protein
VAQDASGAAYAAGYFSGSGSFGGASLTSAGSLDGFAAKLDASGNGVWGKDIGGPGSDVAYAVGVDNAGGVYVGGSFQQTANVAGASLTSFGSDDVFVTKLNSSTGAGVWAVRGGGAGSDVLEGLAVRGVDNVAVAGRYAGPAVFGSATLPNIGSANAFVSSVSGSRTASAAAAKASSAPTGAPPAGAGAESTSAAGAPGTTSKPGSVTPPSSASSAGASSSKPKAPAQGTYDAAVQSLMNEFGAGWSWKQWAV